MKTTQNRQENADHRIPEQTGNARNTGNTPIQPKNRCFVADHKPIQRITLDRHSVPPMLSTSLPTVVASLKDPDQEVLSVQSVLVQAEGVPVPRAGQRLGWVLA